MKKIISIIITAALLCASLTFITAAADAVFEFEDREWTVLQGDFWKGEMSKEQHDAYPADKSLYCNIYGQGNAVQTSGLNIAKAGKYSVKLIYVANQGSATIQFYVDDVKLGSPVDFNNNGGWTASQADLGTVALTDGDHSVKMECTGTTATNYEAFIDKLEFTLVEEAEKGDSITFEFEDRTWTPSGDYWHEDYSNPGLPVPRALYTNLYAAGNYIENGDLTVEKSGKYSVKLVYVANQGSAKIKIYIDGSAVSDEIDFNNNGNWTKTDIGLSDVRLAAGAHTVKVELTGTSSGNTEAIFDKLVLTLLEEDATPDTETPDDTTEPSGQDQPDKPVNPVTADGAVAAAAAALAVSACAVIFVSKKRK